MNSMPPRPNVPPIPIDSRKYATYLELTDSTTKMSDIVKEDKWILYEIDPTKRSKFTVFAQGTRAAETTIHLKFDPMGEPVGSDERDAVATVTYKSVPQPQWESQTRGAMATILTQFYEDR